MVGLHDQTHDAKEDSMAEQDLLERAKQEIRERLEELYPLVEERDRLRAALEAFEAGESEKPASRRAGRQRGRPTTSRRAGRGERRTQLLELLQAEPGLRPSQAAYRMAVNPSQTTHWRGGSRSRERSSAGTARCMRAVRSELLEVRSGLTDPGLSAPFRTNGIVKGTGLQNRQGGAALRLDGSIPSPLRTAEIRNRSVPLLR